MEKGESVMVISEERAKRLAGKLFRTTAWLNALVNDKIVTKERAKHSLILAGELFDECKHEQGTVVLKEDSDDR